ncbi:hypothetical protein Tco_1126408 [Tanacetum coccineum]
MPEHLIYRSERVTRSSHIYDCTKPNVDWDIHPISRSADMFSLTYELRNHHKHTSTSAMSHFTMMEELINRLWKIRIPTCEEPFLIELYELVCKVKDDLRVKSSLSRKESRGEGNQALQLSVGYHQVKVVIRLGLHQMRKEFAEYDDRDRA